MTLSMIVAVARNGVIGADGALPWHLSSDLRRFKALTMGHTIVMGRRTFESIGKALPGRQNIVITRRDQLDPPVKDIEMAKRLDQALKIAESDHVFVIGGAQLYAEAMPCADRVYLTRVEATVNGDTFFPLDRLDDTDSWSLKTDEFHQATEKDDFDCRFQVYVRPAHRVL